MKSRSAQNLQNGMVLKDDNPFRIFVYANMESKLTRCRQNANDSEYLTDQELKRQIVSIDKKRATYYRDYTGLQWGEKLNYDLCVNTTDAIIKEIVPTLAEMFREIKE